MKLIFIEKDGVETKIEMDMYNISDEEINSIKEKFDNREIQKYEIEFLEGVQVKDIHNFEDIKPSMIDSLILRLR